MDEPFEYVSSWEIPWMREADPLLLIGLLLLAAFVGTIWHSSKSEKEPDGRH